MKICNHCQAIVIILLFLLFTCSSTKRYYNLPEINNFIYNMESSILKDFMYYEVKAAGVRPANLFIRRNIIFPNQCRLGYNSISDSLFLNKWVYCDSIKANSYFSKAEFDKARQLINIINKNHILTFKMDKIKAEFVTYYFDSTYFEIKESDKSYYDSINYGLEKLPDHFGKNYTYVFLYIFSPENQSFIANMKKKIKVMKINNNWYYYRTHLEGWYDVKYFSR